ncbi:MAG TPA: hypothetical protein VK840_01115 [Candidatus Dormibacteraeota bacterium]|nr:hypothetical protein [Candidatus Dormibacteraeota bacterium]
MASFIGCLNIGWALPLLYANGVAWHFPWIVLGIIISMACYFIVVFLMSRFDAAVGIQNPFVKALFSLGYWIAVGLAFLLVLLMVKIVARHHGVA